MRAEERLDDVKEGWRVKGEVIFGVGVMIRNLEARRESVGWGMGAEMLAYAKQGRAEP